MNLRLKVANRLQYLGERRTRAKYHVLHVPIIVYKRRKRMLRRLKRNFRRRSPFVMRPVATVELALERDNGVQKRNVI